MRAERGNAKFSWIANEILLGCSRLLSWLFQMDLYSTWELPDYKISKSHLFEDSCFNTSQKRYINSLSSSRKTS